MGKKLENEYSVDKESIWIRTYFYRDKLKAIYDSNLDNETLGIIFRAVMYHIINYGEEPEINDFTVKVAYNMFVADIDRDKAAYILRCKQNHENALKGKKANASDGIRTIADKDKDKDKDKDNDKDTDKDKEKKEKKSLSLLKESDRIKKQSFFELPEVLQKFYLETWLRDYFDFPNNRDMFDEEVQKRLFYILGHEKDKTKSIYDIKNDVCSYWANKKGLKYKKPEMTLEEWEDIMNAYNEDPEIKSSAYNSIKKQIEKGEPINENDVKTVKVLSVYLTTEELEYLQKHGIVD